MQEFLKSRQKFFKLVCGAGNESELEIERLVALYSLAGASVFDISAKNSSIIAAQKGLERSGISQNRFICVSLGIKGDPHISKAFIDKDKCKGCLSCMAVCPQRAISVPVVDNKKCIGCGSCYKYCNFHAINMIDNDVDLKALLSELNLKNISCIELHSSSLNEDDLLGKWQIINEKYNGILSICIDRSNLGNNQVLERLNKMITGREKYSTIIQADGVPMSGGNVKSQYNTTLQAVAMADIINKFNLPVYTIFSGGTNEKTTELAKQCNVDYSGIAVGTYARKIVSEYIKRDDFFSNKNVFNKALDIAKNLVELSIA